MLEINLKKLAIEYQQGVDQMEQLRNPATMVQLMVNPFEPPTRSKEIEEKIILLEALKEDLACRLKCPYIAKVTTLRGFSSYLSRILSE